MKNIGYICSKLTSVCVYFKKCKIKIQFLNNKIKIGGFNAKKNIKVKVSLE